MTNFDIIVLVIIGISTLFAFFKGFIKTIVSLFGWLAAVGITYVSLPHVKPLLLQHFHNEMAVNFLSPTAVFLVALIIMAIINYQIILVATPLRGGTIDRSLGVALGLLRGAFFVCILFIVIVVLSPKLGLNKASDDTVASSEVVTTRQTGIDAAAPQWMKKSQSYPLLKSSAEFLLGTLPTPIQDNVAKLLFKDPSDNKLTLKEQMDLINKMTNILPKEKQDSIKKPDESMSEKQRNALIRDVINAYNGAVKNGDFDKGLIVPEDQIKQLEKSTVSSSVNSPLAKPAPATKETGYDNKERNEIDRLMKTVK
jgi:uncharacterized membrane protein required for colicin V production